jgi:hypothetical protein
MDDFKTREDMKAAIEAQEAENKRLDEARYVREKDSDEVEEANEAYAAGVERMQALMEEWQRRGYS